MAKKSKKTAKKTAKKAAKKHRKLSSWQRFMKQNKGKGLSVKEMAKLFRSKGLAKKKAAKKGKKAKHAKRAKVNTKSQSYRDYARKFRQDVINELVAEGLSLESARKQASETLKQAAGVDAVIEGYKKEYLEAREKDAAKRDEERQKRKDAEERKKDAEAARRADKRASEVKKKRERDAEEAKKRKEDADAFRRDIRRKIKDLEDAETSFSVSPGSSASTSTSTSP